MGKSTAGTILHNLLSHGIAKLAEFLDDDLTEIEVFADQSPLLRELGEQEIVDELRVLIRKPAPARFTVFRRKLKDLMSCASMVRAVQSLSIIAAVASSKTGTALTKVT